MDYQEENPSKLTIDEVSALYEANGWTNYTTQPMMLQQAIMNSLWIYTVRTKDHQIVGLIRAVGDGASVVLIQDLLVHPSYQRQGIGTRLLQEAIRKFQHVYQLQLLTDDTEKTIAFYQSCGFKSVGSINCVSFLYDPEK